MCDFPPITADPPENYILDNVMSSVGQVVTAYCKNTTVAIVKCLPNLTWNATVPSCSVKDRPSDNMSTLLIILWVVGGLLLFSLLILIVVIITSKSKTRCGLRGNGAQNGSVFHISGRGLGRGGDNPAFSRADEICGEWSYHRGDSLQESHRLPSYHEAILNNYITVPARTGNISHHDPPVEGSSDIRSGNQNNEYQRAITNLGSDVAQLQSRSEGTETANEIADEQNTGTNQVHDSTSNATVEQRDSNDQTDSSQSQRNTQQEAASTPRRFAENYPQCFFEEDPPPPYSPGPTNCPSHRLARQHQQNSREHHPGRRRSVHTVTSSQATPTQNDNELLQNPNFRRSMCDRLVNAANSESMSIGHRRHTHIHTSIHSSNPVDVCARQKDRRLDNRTVRKTLSGPTTHLTSDGICANSHYSGSQIVHSNGNHMSVHSNGNHMSEHSNGNLMSEHSNGNLMSVHSNGNHMSRHSNESQVSENSNRNHILGHSNASGKHTAKNRNTFQQNQNSNSSSDSFQNVPSISTVSNSNIYSTHQSYAPTIIFDGSRNKYITDSTRMHDSAVGMTRAVTGLPYLAITSTSLPYHNETLPLGTSTPIDQSPAEVRRFVPANHPSPLTIPHNLPPQHHHLHQSQFTVPIQNYLVEDRGYATNIGQEQTTGQLREGQHFPHVVHSAPLARFDGEYTYL